MAIRLSTRGAPEGEMRTLEMAMEPVDLAAGGADGHGGAVRPEPLWIAMPESGWLHAFAYSLVDSGGQAVPKEALHHFKVIDPSRRELFSPLTLHVIAAGNETSPVSLPKQAGYFVAQGDSLILSAMLHNPTDRELQDVRLTVELQYSPEGPWAPPQDVVPFFSHVTPPLEETSYDIPPGVSERSLELRPSVSGTILGLGGHLHRYGTSVRLEDVTEGRVLWEQVAVRAPDGTIVELGQDVFVWSQGPKLRTDRTYRVTATYDNPTGSTIVAGGMGTVGGVIVPDAPWPHVDRHAPEYVWQIEREIGPPGGEEPLHVH
jgi:hypothetical protein